MIKNTGYLELKLQTFVFHRMRLCDRSYQQALDRAPSLRLFAAGALRLRQGRADQWKYELKCLVGERLPRRPMQ